MLAWRFLPRLVIITTQIYLDQRWIPRGGARASIDVAYDQRGGRPIVIWAQLVVRGVCPNHRHAMADLLERIGGCGGWGAGLFLVAYHGEFA